MKIGITNITFSALNYLNLLVFRDSIWEDAVVTAYNGDVHLYFAVWQADRWLHEDKEADQAEVKFRIGCWRA